MTGGAGHRLKGARIERELIQLHRDMGIKAERVPLSGASRYRGAGHDVDVYALGDDAAPLVFEVKGRGGAGGFRLLERWLADYDGLALRRDRQHPLVVLAWHSWARTVTAIERLRHAVESLAKQLVERDRELEECRAELRRLKSELQDATYAKPGGSAAGDSNGQTNRPDWTHSPDHPVADERL